MFLEAHSFPRASLSENCSLLGTDNVRGQISVHIFAPNGDYSLYRKLMLHDINATFVHTVCIFSHGNRFGTV